MYNTLKDLLFAIALVVSSIIAIITFYYISIALLGITVIAVTYVIYKLTQEANQEIRDESTKYTRQSNDNDSA